MKKPSFKIGSLLISPPVVLAPMAGVTDRAFREIAAPMGCGLVYTEMVSARALVYKNKKTLAMLKLEERVVPVGVQIFGSDPEIMAEAACMVEEIAEPDLIDINMGCPTPKIVNNGDGSALLKNPELAARIVERVKKAVKVPLTVKIRKGWKKSSEGLTTARFCQEAGACAVAVHGRTRQQFYSGEADWDFIRLVKEELDIPVIGNGSIFEPRDALNMFNTTGCDGIMVARGAMGNPWLIARINSLLFEGRELPPPEPEEKLEVLKLHFERACTLKSEKVAIKEMRKHVTWYLKGLPASRKIKNRVFSTESLEEIQEILVSYEKMLQGQET